MLKVWKVEGDKERKTQAKNIAYGQALFLILLMSPYWNILKTNSSS